GVLAQPGERGGERRAGRGRVATGWGEAGAGQVAFGSLHGGQLPGLVTVQHGQQAGGGGSVGELPGGAGAQRPRPPQVLVTDPQGAGVVQGGAGTAERVGGLAAGGGGERLHHRDERLVLRVFAGPQVTQPGQHLLGGGGVAAQRRQPGPAAGEVFDVGQAV